MSTLCFCFIPLSACVWLSQCFLFHRFPPFFSVWQCRLHTAYLNIYLMLRMFSECLKWQVLSRVRGRGQFYMGGKWGAHTVSFVANKTDWTMFSVFSSVVLITCVKHYEVLVCLKRRTLLTSRSLHSAEILSVQTHSCCLSIFMLCSSAAASPPHACCIYR